MLERKLQLPPPGKETFFLWGPRQTGKSTLLRSKYPDAVWIDLLKAEEYRRYLSNPEYLRQELPDQGDMPFVVIDEVQKIPNLLDEVHWLHENVMFSLLFVDQVPGRLNGDMQTCWAAERFATKCLVLCPLNSILILTSTDY
jgi:hypothetical protein